MKRERKKERERDIEKDKEREDIKGFTHKSMTDRDTAYLKNSYNPYKNILQICGNVYHCLFVFIKLWEREKG